MTRTIEEQLSAFADGEIPAEEMELLIRRLAREPDHRATLARYSLIGAVIRGDAATPDLRNRVQSSIEAEAAEMEVSEAGAAYGFNGKRLFAGAGIAATVAAAAILVVSGPDTTGLQVPEASAPQVAATSTTVAEPSASDALVVQPVAQPAVRRAVFTPERQNSYQMAHGAYSRPFSWTVMDSRIVTTQSEEE